MQTTKTNKKPVAKRVAECQSKQMNIVFFFKYSPCACVVAWHLVFYYNNTFMADNKSTVSQKRYK